MKTRRNTQRRGRVAPRHKSHDVRSPTRTAHPEADLMVDDTSTFFGDLTGARSRPTGRCTTASGTTASRAADVPAAVTTLPGESVAVQTDGQSSEQTQDQVMWLQLGLCKALIRAVTHLGFIAPTPVQVAAIPPALRGADVCARAVTGSGKTAAFLLPMLHLLLTRPPAKASRTGSQRRFIRALVLLPTRELGVQCEAMLRQLMHFTSELHVALAIGGVAASSQEAALDAGPDVLLATPGRLVDFLHNRRAGAGCDLSGVELVVLDECDKLLTVTLRDQVIDILQRIPVETRQVLVFSATMTDDVDRFATEQLYKPHNVDIGHVALQSKLRQHFVRVVAPPVAATPDGDRGDSDAVGTSQEDTGQAKHPRGVAAAKDEDSLPYMVVIKTRYLVALCRHYVEGKSIVFCRYRTTVHRLTLLFQALQWPTVEIQGNQSQEQRLHALERFAQGDARYLITTDVAARGLDIANVATVINFDLPPTLTAYIHRVGRTARIGHTGTAISLVEDVTDAEVMRKILAVSGTMNGHQIASVKRRDITAAELREAGEVIDDVFPQVRTQLAAERLEERVAQAEKRYKVDATVADQVTARPQKSWCLSREERQRREAEARRLYEKEAEVTLRHFQNELASLEREENGLRREQKMRRRADKERRAREQERNKEQMRLQRKKVADRINAGAVKKLKKMKIRQAVRERRAQQREKRGRPAARRGAGRKTSKKSRHSRGVKKH